MDAIITYIEELAQISPYIKLYRDFNSNVILRNIGKITGEVDKQYVEFLLKTNGASILDYCFLGLKNIIGEFKCTVFPIQMYKKV